MAKHIVIDRAFLEPKFTSEDKERIADFVRTLSYNYSVGDLVPSCANTMPVQHDPSYDRARITFDSHWWLLRELLRIRHGVYLDSSILARLRTSPVFAHYVPHVSSEDPKMIAYTASVEDGLRDKQTRTTLGRFLRKHCLLFTDAHIQRLEQDHAAETVATYTVATDVAEIERVYTTMSGDTGCMRYSKEHFGLPVHPSAVYAAPGMGVAYTQSEDGRVMSRSVVWVNPNDPKDKRYVRIYGAPVLARLLERDGYRLGSLAGAKLPAIRSPKHGPDQYVMPYLDGPAGAQSDRSGAGVLLSADHTWFTLVDGEGAGLDSWTARFVALGRSTSARVTVEPATDPLMMCELTGRLFDQRDEEKITVYHMGRKVATTITNLQHHWKMWVENGGVLKPEMGSTGSIARLYEFDNDNDPNAGTTLVFNGMFTPETTVFVHGSRRYIDTPAARHTVGHKLLDPQLYGSGVYCDQSFTVSARVTRADGTVEYATVKHDDAMLIVRDSFTGDEPMWDYYYASTEEARVQMRKDRKLILCSPVLEGVKSFVCKDHPRLRRTKGKTVFVEGLHSQFCQDALTGEWESTSKLMFRFRVGEKHHRTSVRDCHSHPKYTELHRAELLTVIDGLGVESVRPDSEEQLNLFAGVIFNGMLSRAVKSDAGIPSAMSADTPADSLTWLWRGSRTADVSIEHIRTAVQIIRQDKALPAESRRTRYDETDLVQANLLLEIYDQCVATLRANMAQPAPAPTSNPDDQLLADLGVQIAA